MLGLGEVSLDRVFVVDGPLAPGDKRNLLDQSERPGGQMATALLGMARLGLATRLLAAVGRDPEAERALEPLERAGVDLTGVVRIAGRPTRQALITVDATSGERSVIEVRDAGLHLDPAGLAAAGIAGSRLLAVDCTEPDAALAAARIARAAGVPVMLDADRRVAGLDELLVEVDFPVVSRVFAEEFGGSGSVREGLRALCAGGCRGAVATLGEYGALARAGEVEIESPAFEVEAIDTTGAGDAFHAGFAWGLLQGWELPRMLRVANAVAALNCLAPGAQGGLPDREQVATFLAGHEPRAWREP